MCLHHVLLCGWGDGGGGSLGGVEPGRTIRDASPPAQGSTDVVKQGRTVSLMGPFSLRGPGRGVLLAFSYVTLALGDPRVGMLG